MIVFVALVGVACFTAGYLACALMVVSADADRRYIDEMARRDQIR